MDKKLSSIIQQNKADLQTNHYQNTWDFTPSTQPTPYQYFLAPPPAHLMQPPEGLLPEPPLSHFIRPQESPLIPSFFHPSHMPHLTVFHAYPAQPDVMLVLPPPSLPFVSPQTMIDGIIPSHIANTMHTHSRATHSVDKKAFCEKKYPFLQQIYKIGSFEIPICDTQYVRNACMQQFGYITFDDYTYNEYFFLSNFFSCKTSFSIDNQKTQWMSVIALISVQKLNYFSPPLSIKTKEAFVAELKEYENMQWPHCTLEAIQKFKAKTQHTHTFQEHAWKKISLVLVFQAMYHKFNSSEELKEKLLKTGNKVIIYHNRYKDLHIIPKTWYHSSFWGVDPRSGIGYNTRGNLLCLVREYLRNGKTPPPPIAIPDQKKL